jgi:hypothetical protein
LKAYHNSCQLFAAWHPAMEQHANLCVPPGANCGIETHVFISHTPLKGLCHLHAPVVSGSAPIVKAWHVELIVAPATKILNDAIDARFLSTIRFVAALLLVSV